MFNINDKFKSKDKQLEVYSGIETSVISISEVSGLQNELDTKQNLLTAGNNITIVDNVISSSGGTADTTALQAQADTNTSDISSIQTNKQTRYINSRR
jgi:adenine/guanine phosphoribosyltransferase-like PRPP-binding protein